MKGLLEIVGVPSLPCKYARVSSNMIDNRSSSLKAGMITEIYLEGGSWMVGNGFGVGLDELGSVYRFSWALIQSSGFLFIEMVA